MIHQLKHPKSDISRAVHYFKSANESKKIACDGNVEKFVFLCGANQSQGVPSRRRNELLKFANNSLDNCRFFLAEKVFDVLIQEHGEIHNLLDLEKELSKVC